MKKIATILLMFFCLFLITGCQSNKYITEVNYSKLEKMLKNKETFAIEIYQTGCTFCESLKPKLNRVLKEYDIHIYSINKADLSNKDRENLKKLYGDVGTPTIIFIEEGEEKGILYRLVGDHSEKQIISKFKSNGYINEENKK